jgi:ribonuclease VapC
MVIDSSALIAILQEEQEAVQFIDLVAASQTCLISAVSMLESSMVVGRHRGTAGLADLERFLTDGAIEVVAFDRLQAETALSAHARYGKRRHPANLNLGDCCAYALAMVTGEPLLFKGEDFRKMDITEAT